MSPWRPTITLLRTSPTSTLKVALRLRWKKKAGRDSRAWRRVNLTWVSSQQKIPTVSGRELCACPVGQSHCRTKSAEKRTPAMENYPCATFTSSPWLPFWCGTFNTDSHYHILFHAADSQLCHVSKNRGGKPVAKVTPTRSYVWSHAYRSKQISVWLKLCNGCDIRVVKGLGASLMQREWHFAPCCQKQVILTGRALVR